MRRAASLLLICVVAAFGQPARIVSTSPSITETLFALGAGREVVGVSTYCRYPPAVRRIPKVGSYSRPIAEQIARLRPDLAIIHKQAGELRNRLQALGIAVVEVDEGYLAQVYTSIHTIGRAVGRSRQAEELTGKIKAGITGSVARRAGGSHPSVLLIVGRDPDQLTRLVAAGSGSYLGELLEAAGSRNVIGGEYPRISLETVIRLDPDVLIDASGMGDEPNNSPAQVKRTLQPWLARGDLKAVREGRVHAVLSEALVVPGPRVLDALALLSGCIDAKGEK